MKFDPVIGFEAHAELKTDTKVFCGCKVDFGAAPNTNVCPVCLGMPGSLPVLNRKAVEYVLRTSLALNCTITERSAFDRKNYYYPDLPKNYQISEQYAIIGVNGWFDVPLEDGETRRVRINNVHLEEDAGKNVHPESGEDYSLVDLNRAGTPLMEIVTEPDLRSVDEAEAFMKALKNLLQYIDVCDCKMQEGSLRFELNVSVKEQGSDEIKPKYVEVKNVASMKTVMAAAKYEIKRQSRAYKNGEEIAKETRLWDEAAARTRAMRGKEGANDYRYFPDPDLCECVISPEWQEEVRATIPELQPAKQTRFVEQYGLPEYDAAVLTQSAAVADYFEAVVAAHDNAKSASNWMMTEILREIGERDIEPDELKTTPQQLGAMIAMIDDGKISGKIAKQVLPEMLETGDDPSAIVEKKGLVQISDTSEIEALVDEVIAEEPKVADDVRSGNKKAIGRLVGGVMKKSKGKANPQLVNKLLAEKLS